MDKATESLHLKINGMTCVNCENKVQKSIKRLEGIISVEASYNDSDLHVVYQSDLVGEAEIIQAVEKAGYGAEQNKKSSSNSYTDLLTIGIIILVIYLLIDKTVGFNFLPEIDKNLGYGMLFVIGLLTSIHCIAMCGGINLSQTIAYSYEDKNWFSKHKASILYNIGRVISYTIIGGIVGALGSAISFSGSARGIVAVISGAFMVIMGLNMFGTFKWLRKLNPRMPKLLSDQTAEKIGKSGPLYVGLLNGLMPCGPLQAMQLYALGTGNMIAGAISMFLFSLGTVPLMFIFGATSAYLGKRFTANLMKVSAVLVMILGVIMLNRGFSLSGISFANFIN